MLLSTSRCLDPRCSTILICLPKLSTGPIRTTRRCWHSGSASPGQTEARPCRPLRQPRRCTSRAILCDPAGMGCSSYRRCEQAGCVGGPFLFPDPPLADFRMRKIPVFARQRFYLMLSVPRPDFTRVELVSGPEKRRFRTWQSRSFVPILRVGVCCRLLTACVGRKCVVAVAARTSGFPSPPVPAPSVPRRLRPLRSHPSSSRRASRPIASRR